MVEAPVLLGIETSCDETAAAVVRGGCEVLANVVASQNELHEEYGGVVPEIASRAHIQRILPVVREALTQAGIDQNQIDAIAVGHRPGLIGSLIVGVAAAKALAWAWEKPLIGVDHIAAHLHAGSLEAKPPLFPALGLVVSGGHTNIFFMRSALDSEVLGRTIDDAVGEAYDKAATILGLGYPGGPLVDQRAQVGNERAHNLPISRLAPDSLDFSFSGLKTALLYAVRGVPQRRGQETRFQRDHTALTDEEKNDFCASFQRAAMAAVILKLERALDHLSQDEETKPRSFVIGGGVSANSRLRADAAEFADRHGLVLHLPRLTYCMDNAAMIAGLGGIRFRAGLFDDLSLSPAAAGTY